jgi:hypothetical protein
VAVIGFLSYEDFVAELEAIRPDGFAGIVRVQDCYRKKVEAGLPGVEFLIELAATHEGDVAVCRFKMGSGWDVEHEREAREQDQANVERAVQLVTADLHGRGFTVRPGVIAAAAQSETVATSSLWTWERQGERRVLVARAKAMQGEQVRDA